MLFPAYVYYIYTQPVIPCLSCFLFVIHSRKQNTEPVIMGKDYSIICISCTKYGKTAGFLRVWNVSRIRTLQIRFSI